MEVPKVVLVWENVEEAAVKMKKDKPKKAPKVNSYNMDKNYMKESDSGAKRQNPQAPMTKKRLSK